jgi:hypothetical protein
MPRGEDSARLQTREVLVTLRDALGQPPLPAMQRVVIEGVLDLLGEGDVNKRVAARDRLDGMLAELDGRLEP